MIAGVVNLDGAPVSEELVRDLRSRLSRNPEEHIYSARLPGAAVFRASVGSLSSYTGLMSLDEGSISALAGEPLTSGATVEDDHALISRGLRSGDVAPLRTARGVFCGVEVGPCGHGMKVVLYADRLGSRPLYYWSSGTRLVFSTALRMIEGLASFRPQRDERGTVEWAAFGYPIGNRTIYDGVRVVRDGEIVTLSLDSQKRESYWRWDGIPEATGDRREIVEDLHRVFRDAITLRLRQDTQVVAFLSGGLDSRAVTSILSESGARVSAFNYGPPQSQDWGLAKRFADAAGFTLQTGQVTGRGADFRLGLAFAVRSEFDTGRAQATRPYVIWSGDGGDVALGNVFMDDEIVRDFRAGPRKRALEVFFSKNWISLPERLLKPSVRESTVALVESGISEELDGLQTSDPAQAIYLFLMTNAKRRHLHNVFEHLDLHRVEYQVPFYDSEFLRVAASIPVDYRNLHRCYHDWLRAFPDYTRSTAWQVYPGHEECPIPLPPGLSYQWEVSPVEDRGEKSRIGLSAIELSLSAEDLGPVSRVRLAGVGALQLLRLRDSVSALKAVVRFRCPPSGGMYAQPKVTHPGRS